jgi:uncharacterized protein YceH (UPF0502 family)
LKLELTANEARVLGSLMEKSVITPDQYPLTLNALTLACNQKSSRDPTMSLDPGTVERTARALADKHLVSIDDNFRARAMKFSQRFCNTPFAECQLNEPEFALICLLLLRGAQTPGELRARSGRLYEFVDNAAVETTLTGLIERPDGPFVARRPMKAGRRDFEYMHLFCGPIESVDAASAPRALRTTETQGRDRVGCLESRIDALERELEALKRILSTNTQ